MNSTCGRSSADCAPVLFRVLRVALGRRLAAFLRRRRPRGLFRFALAARGMTHVCSARIRSRFRRTRRTTATLHRRVVLRRLRIPPYNFLLALFLRQLFLQRVVLLGQSRRALQRVLPRLRQQRLLRPHRQQRFNLLHQALRISILRRIRHRRHRRSSCKRPARTSIRIGSGRTSSALRRRLPRVRLASLMRIQLFLDQRALVPPALTKSSWSSSNSS